MATVDTFFRLNLINAVLAVLEGISEASGYNTTPFVTGDFRRYDEDDSTYSIFLDEGTEDLTDVGVSVGTIVFEMSIHGAVKVGTGDPKIAYCRLLQDVRRAVFGQAGTLASQADGAVVVKPGRCDVEQILLMDEDTIVFEQVVIFEYKQNASNW